MNAERSLFLLLPVLFIGCATLKPGDIPDPAFRVRPEEPRAELALDFFQFRLDIARKKIESEGMAIMVNRDGTYKMLTDDVPHHYLGVYLGNGIFTDLNGNLSVDIVRLLGFDAAPSFRLRRISDGPAEGADEYIKDGDTLTIRQGSKKVVVAIEENKVSVTTGRYYAPAEITREDGELRMTPTGMFTEFRKSFLRKSGDMFRASSGYRVERDPSGIILLDGTHSVAREGDSILYRAGGRTLLTMVRSENRYAFFRSDKHGFFIDRLPDRIRIHLSGGVTEYSYTLDYAASR